MRAHSFALGIATLLAVASATSTHAAGSASAKTAHPAARSTAHAKAVVPFMEDAYTKAVAEARARKVPIFVEAWAPW